MLLEKKLHFYSLFAVSFLFKNGIEVNGQVIYSDIDPDVALTGNDEYLLIDMDHNTTSDFLFLKTSGTWVTTYSWSVTYFKHLDLAGPYYEENQITGRIVTHGAGGPSTAFAYKLIYGDLVEEDNWLFYNVAGQQLASMIITDLGWLNIGIGEFANDSTEGYIGVKFIDESECYHYGWIRLEIDNACRNIIIKDYAYETECDYPILAGSKEHYVGMTELPVEDIQIYASHNQVFVNFQNGFLAESFISIYNTSAEKIYGAVLNASENIITLDHPPGMYVVEVGNKKNRIVKKILLE